MQLRRAPTLRSPTSMRPPAQAPGGARCAAMSFRLLSVAALIPLAPPFRAAGRLAEHASERAAAQPAAVFPMLARPDWGEQDARFGAYRGGHVHEGQDVFAPAGTPLVAIRDGRVVETGDDAGRGNYTALCGLERRGEGRAARRGGRLHGLVLGRPPASRGAARSWHDGPGSRPAPAPPTAR